MKGLEKQKNLHVRVSDAEMQKYRLAANELGLSVSSLVRFSMNKQMRLLSTGKEEQIQF